MKKEKIYTIALILLILISTFIAFTIDNYNLIIKSVSVESSSTSTAETEGSSSEGSGSSGGNNVDVGRTGTIGTGGEGRLIIDPYSRPRVGPALVTVDAYLNRAKNILDNAMDLIKQIEKELELLFPEFERTNESNSTESNSSRGLNVTVTEIEPISNSIRGYSIINLATEEEKKNLYELVDRLEEYNKEISKYLEEAERLKNLHPYSKLLRQRYEELLDIKQDLDNLIEKTIQKIELEEYTQMLEERRQTDLLRSINHIQNEIEIDNLITSDNCVCIPLTNCIVPVSDINYAFSFNTANYGKFGIVEVICSCDNNEKYSQLDICLLDLNDNITIQQTDERNLVISDRKSPEEKEEFNTQVTRGPSLDISFSEKNEEVSLSPLKKEELCENKILDIGEDLIDCGGNCNECMRYEEKKKPLILWGVLVILIFILYVNNFFRFLR